MADNYDFQIDSLKFRMAEQRNLPYLRTTAPFRKEQLDTSATVGDQSLTGWWTRGQLSFHMGAGLKYYEVLEDEVVLNRFEESEHVKIFEPGEVTLDILPATISSTADGVALAVPNFYNRLVAVDQLGIAHYWTGSGATTAVTSNDAAGFRYITALGEDWFGATNGGKVEAWYQDAFIETSYSISAPGIYFIWGGKNRLWMVDWSGRLFVKATYPTSPPVALTGEVCIFPQYNLSRISFTDSGGAVFASVGYNEIFAFVPANDGSVATLTAPVVAAVLPQGESISCIRAHMGILTIATSKGVRFALIDGDSLIVGPIVVDFVDCHAKEIGVTGSTVWVTGEDADTSTVCYEFDLSNPIAGLKFPYRKAWFGQQDNFVNGPWTGSVEMTSDTVVFWGGDNTLSSDLYFETTYGQTTLEPTGYVRTSYHRFGTLDNKRFVKLVVRASGTGTIEAFKIDGNNTETSLGTMNASAGVATFDIGDTAAAERMAFKFVLNRATTTTGPTLLGYQVKALPVPERHELLRVPLIIADYVTLKHGTRVGTQGKGYSDLLALKALENAQAIVTFTDHRTGETGTAYIDQVEFQDNQPATYNDNGFGGYAYVTLRVID